MCLIVCVKRWVETNTNSCTTFAVFNSSKRWVETTVGLESARSSYTGLKQSAVTQVVW